MTFGLLLRNFCKINQTDINIKTSFTDPMWQKESALLQTLKFKPTSMKHTALFFLLGLLSATSFAQADFEFIPVFNGTFYQIAVKDSPTVMSDVRYFLPVSESLRIDTTQTKEGYAPVEGGGWVSMACISENRPTEQEIQAMRKAFAEKSSDSKGNSSSRGTDPCVEADRWSERYKQTGKAVDLDKYREWIAKCVEKEY
jgi:hypothetical protein